MLRLESFRAALRWLPSYALQLASRRAPSGRPLHVMLAIANHFEPEFVPGTPATFASLGERERRVEAWCRRYPEVVDSWRDEDGQPLRHTYFYPAEHYHPDLVERLAIHAREGWGELEIHLHHGVNEPDTAARTQAALLTFRNQLAGHGCLAY